MIAEKHGPGKLSTCGGQRTARKRACFVLAPSCFCSIRFSGQLGNATYIQGRSTPSVCCVISKFSGKHPLHPTHTEVCSADFHGDSQFNQIYCSCPSVLQSSCWDFQELSHNSQISRHVLLIEHRVYVCICKIAVSGVSW